MRLCRAERFPPVYNLNSRRSQMSMKLVRCVAEPTSHSTVLQVGGPPFTCGCVAFWRIKPLDISATVLATIRKFEGEGYLGGIQESKPRNGKCLSILPFCLRKLVLEEPSFLGVRHLIFCPPAAVTKGQLDVHGGFAQSSADVRRTSSLAWLPRSGLTIPRPQQGILKAHTATISQWHTQYL